MHEHGSCTEAREGRVSTNAPIELSATRTVRTTLGPSARNSSPTAQGASGEDICFKAIAGRQASVSRDSPKPHAKATVHRRRAAL
eukprot:6201156-Pleurochrysis_carterae.AAC.2